MTKKARKGGLQVGSFLHYYPVAGKDPGPHPGEHPLAAIVSAVLTENSVNLMVIQADGFPYGAQSVLFLKKGDSPMGNAYCEAPGHHDVEDEAEHEESPDLEKQRHAAEEAAAAVEAAKEAEKAASKKKT